MTLPRDHIMEPYTRMSCDVVTASALFSTTLMMTMTMMPRGHHDSHTREVT